MLEVKNLTKIYKSKKDNQIKAIDNISLQLPNKGLVFIVGKSECGKSTLLNLLGAVDSFDSGEILINSLPLSKFTNKELDDYRNYTLGFIFQEFNLLEEYTVYKNLEIVLHLSNEESKNEKIRKVLEIVGLNGFENRIVSELSGGQKQKLTIARAIIKKPSIILCDNPISSLDAESSKSILELLKEISKESLIIVTTYDKELAYKFGNRVIELSDGKIIKNEQNVKQNENNCQNEKNNKKNYHVSIKNKFLLARKHLKKRPIRLSVSIILSVLCFILIGTSSVVTSINENSLITHSMIKNDNRFITYSKASYYENGDQALAQNMNDEDISYLAKELKTNELDIVYDYYNKTLPYLNVDWEVFRKDNYGCYYYTSINGFTEINNEFINRYRFSLIGQLPQNDDEVVITKYFFNIYKKFGYKKDNQAMQIQEYSDLLNKTISISDSEFGERINFKIVGILDTKFDESRYAPLLTENVNLNKNKILVNEIDEIMDKGGLHNIIYLSPGYYQRNIKPLYKSKYISNKEFYFFNVNNKDHNYFKNNYLTTISTLTDQNSFPIYYKNSAEKTLNGNKILLPLSLTNIKKGANASLIKINTEQDIYNFALEHFDEIKEQFIERFEEEDQQFVKAESYYYYIISLKSNQKNEYHPGKTYTYFEIPYIQKELEEKHFKNFENIIMQGEYKQSNYDVELLGFYDDDWLTSNVIYTSEALYNQIISDLNYKLYDYKYVVTPISKNYKDDLKKIEFREKKRDEKIKIVDSDKSSKYSLYRVNNEVTNTVNNISGILQNVVLVLKYISIFLIIIAIIFMNYYFYGLVYDKKKEIMTLHSIGVSKKDTLNIFLCESILIITIITLLSFVLLIVLIQLINFILMKEFYFSLSILHITAKEFLIITLICALSIALGVIIPLLSLIRKRFV